MRNKGIGKYLILIVMIVIIAVSGYNLWSMSERYVREKQVNEIISKYRPDYVSDAPEPPEPTEGIKTTETADGEHKPQETHKNPFIMDLQAEVNTDIIGWLNIPDTNIDYPFVISGDNDYYLRRDVFGNYALAGTVFMDYRCSGDFTGFNTIIYGHNMKNNSMFGDLLQFDDEGFFETVRFGTIFLKDKTYTLEFFAYMSIKKDDNIIYNPYELSETEKDEFLEYVKGAARNYREPAKENSVVTLSTCSYDGSARIVLLANIININMRVGGKYNE